MVGPKAAEDLRQQQILDAAFQVAVQNGVDRLTVRDVAAAAGLSSGLVFFHFKTKDALLLAMLDALIEWWLGTGEAALALDESADLLSMLRTEANAQGDEGNRVDLLLQFWLYGRHRPAVQKKLRDALKRYRQLFLGPAQAIAQANRRRYQQMNLESLAALMVSVVVGTALQASLDPRWQTADDSLSAFERLLTA
jgi:AcrR family transcriptional regulator